MLVANGGHSSALKTVHFTGIVYNIPQTIKVWSGIQLLFCFMDGIHHPKAEAAVFVYLNGYHE